MGSIRRDCCNKRAVTIKWRGDMVSTRRTAHTHTHNGGTVLSVCPPHHSTATDRTECFDDKVLGGEMNYLYT